MASKESDKDIAQQIQETFRNPQTKVDEVIRLYDQWKDYDKDLLEMGYKLDKHYDEMEDFLRINKDCRILDVAAGTGLSGQKLKERGYSNIDALDGSAGMLDQAKEKGIYKNCVLALLGNHPIEGIEKDAYDALLCIGGLSSHHVRYDCFESLAAITKPGGYIYFLGSVEWLFEEKEKFEDEMRRLEKGGIWRCILKKESPDSYYTNDHALIYAFKVLK